MKYIISENYSLRGWKKLPYGLQNIYTGETEFMYKPMYSLLLDCNGLTDIQPEKLSEEDRQILEKWEKDGFIRKAAEGETLKEIQHYRSYPNRFKQEVLWSLTGCCNYKCKHCFMSAPHGAQGQPSFDDLMTMLDAFARCGIHTVGLTGGEPLIRRDFWDIVDAIIEKKIVITTIYSNGLLVTDDFLDKLAARHIRPNIQFSFDGVGYHDWMRGVKGAEKYVLDAIKRCNERGFAFTASMSLCRDNKDSIRETVKLLGELGCKYLKICNTSPQGEWKDQPEHYLKQTEAYQTFLDYIPQYFEDGKPCSIGLEGFFNCPGGKAGSDFVKYGKEEKFGKQLMCGEVRRTMYVSPTGNVLSCMPMIGTPIEDQFPNMLKIPLEEILDSDSLYMTFSNYRVSDYMAHNADCRECEYREMCCGGCRAVAINTSPDDYLGKDLNTCEFFRGGWKKKVDELLKSLGVETEEQKET